MSRVSTQTSMVQAEASPAVARVMGKACACGAPAGAGGQCSPCARARRLTVQAKLSLGTPGDRYEQEADRIADQVLSGPVGSSLPAGLSVTPLVQRQSVEQEEEETLQTKASSIGSQRARPSGLQQAASAVAGRGFPLTRADRSFFEPRFGHDLSHVRLHTGVEAQSAARRINARAYTLGNNIAFAPGQYEPETPRGRHLLAHELTHTFQQMSGRTIRRTCPSDPAQIPAGTKVDFETRASEALNHRTYKTKLNWKAKGYTRHIIDGARASACPMYYIDKLLKMFNTPMASGDELAKENRKETEGAATKEKERLADPYLEDLAGVEEDIADLSVPNFVTREGEGGKLFRVDRTDPTHIVVRMKVLLKPKGKGTEDDVKRTEAIEDAIEIASATRGYVLDIKFVKTNGADDVFTVGVDPSQWTNSGNWVGDPQTIAHEAHHLLGLEDRYNYIEGHAENENMVFEDRLFWFREQMVRAFDPLADQSMMKDEHSAGSMNEQDICALAGGNFDDCINARLGDLPVGQIEGRAKALLSPYIPQNAAMIERLREAWNGKPEKDRKRNCSQTDPVCGSPPKAVFGVRNDIETDADKFPLTNPHEQPAGETLKRQRKWQ